MRTIRGCFLNYMEKPIYVSLWRTQYRISNLANLVIRLKADNHWLLPNSSAHTFFYYHSGGKMMGVWQEKRQKECFITLKMKAVKWKKWLNPRKCVSTHQSRQWCLGKSMTMVMRSFRWIYEWTGNRCEVHPETTDRGVTLAALAQEKTGDQEDIHTQLFPLSNIVSWPTDFTITIFASEEAHTEGSGRIFKNPHSKIIFTYI